MDHLNSKLNETQNLIKVKMNIWWKSKGIQVWNYTLKNYGPLLGKGWTASRLQRHYKEIAYFSPLIKSKSIKWCLKWSRYFSKTGFFSKWVFHLDEEGVLKLTREL